MSYTKEIIQGGWSLVEGMIVTVRRLFQPLITVQYPRKKLEISSAFRGHIELKKFEDTGTHKCIACLTCEKMCPSNVIKVEGERAQAKEAKEGEKAAKGAKVGVYYVIDFSKCSLCGICVDVCPTDTLQFSKEYQLVGQTGADCVYDLISRLTNGAQVSRPAIPEPPKEPKKPKAAAAEPAAE